MAELLAMRGQFSLLFVTHDLRLIQADEIYRLDRGRLSLHCSETSDIKKRKYGMTLKLLFDLRGQNDPKL